MSSFCIAEEPPTKINLHLSVDDVHAYFPP